MRNLKELFKKNPLENFFFESQIIRRWRSFFNLKFFPYLQKTFLITLLLIVTIFFGLKFFKPQYLSKINIAISSYFFRNLHLDNYNFDKIKVSGNNRVLSQEIIEQVTKSKNRFNQTVAKNNNETLIQILTKDLKHNLPWINQISITRTLPNSLNISISEYEPFALWQNNGQKYVIDKDGNKVPIDNDEEFQHLVILSGNSANVNAKSLFNIFVVNPELSTKIYSATWIGNRRWDIRFENGLLVKLPADNLQEAWHNLIKIYSLQGSLNNLQVIDLRIAKKIYLKYSDREIQEIRNFKL